MLSDIWTVFWRDWVVLKHRMTAFILSRMVAPLLYLVAFGWGLGRSIQTAKALLTLISWFRVFWP